jgi:hypothetical protein
MLFVMILPLTDDAYTTIEIQIYLVYITYYPYVFWVCIVSLKENFKLDSKFVIPNLIFIFSQVLNISDIKPFNLNLIIKLYMLTPSLYNTQVKINNQI